jgi:signal transduction histidine kinase
MAASVVNATPEDRDRAYRLRLKDERSPAVVIDCSSARVVAANAGGIDALGLKPSDRFPAPLDSAMPAMMVLRDFVQRLATGPERHTLVFWRHGRTSTQPCDVTSAGASPSHAIVIFRNDGDRAQFTEPSIPPDARPSTFESALAANDDSPPPIVRDDRETLKEIARRIREGHTRQSRDADEGDEPRYARTTPISEPESERRLASSEQPAIAETDQAPWPRATNIEVTEGAEPAPKMPEAPALDTATETSAPLGPKRALSVQSSLAPDDVAKLAHELKTPLSAIAAAAEIMRDQRLGPMGHDTYLGYAADIHDSATHALAVISEMLSTSSLNASRRTSGNAFELSELAARTVSSLQPLADQRSITLALDSNATLQPIRANPTAVRQILLNLLTNALKFTPPGGDVRVGTGYLDDGAIYLVVRDTGDGMSATAVEHAFDDTSDALTARAGGGRGIGLRLVRRLAAENGAEFEIDTAPGRGTVVLIAFPKDLVGVTIQAP